jgi:hypothetical protein
MTDSEWIAACDWMDRNWVLEARAGEIGLDQCGVKLCGWLNTKTSDQAKRFFRRGRIAWGKAAHES